MMFMYHKQIPPSLLLKNAKISLIHRYSKKVFILKRHSNYSEMLSINKKGGFAYAELKYIAIK